MLRSCSNSQKRQKSITFSLTPGDSPSCSHGPMLRVVKSGSAVARYVCSAFNRKSACESDLCQLSSVPNWPVKMLRKITPEQRCYCSTCDRLFICSTEELDTHRKHRLMTGISDQLLKMPSFLLSPRSDADAHAQYLFSLDTLNNLYAILHQIGVNYVLCIGTPRLHEFIQLQRSLNGLDMSSFLLDLDARLGHFYRAKMFARFNMVNGHFFSAKRRRKFKDIMRTIPNTARFAIICDPPFKAPLILVYEQMLLLIRRYLKHVVHWVGLPFDTRGVKCFQIFHLKLKDRNGSESGNMRPWIRLGVVCLSLFLVYLTWCSFRPVYHSLTSGGRHASFASHATLPSRAPAQCTYHTCFDASQCAKEYPGRPLNRIGVYVYVPDASSRPVTRQFAALIQAVRTSRYAVRDLSEACVFVPDLDLLNARRGEVDKDLRLINRSPQWNNGVNHLLFNILPGKELLFSGQAILVGGGHTRATYRATYDVAIPAYNPLLRRTACSQRNSDHRPVLLTILPLADRRTRSRAEQALSAYRDHSSTILDSNQTVMLLRHSASIDPVQQSDRIPSMWATVVHNSHRATEPESVLVDYEDTLCRSTFCAVARADPLGYLGL
ncbi:unnamed protein product, partial [Echinostoma caproni]|uniref:Exostosin domain-containing protein n=1 Tax=Echinostoma caproni TaxID=27848 RepID=A0A183B498_9TREM